MLVFNNKPGRDAELLEHYREPSWNNPVVRFFDGKQKELLERRDGVYAAGALSDRMVRALEAARAAVPGYLALVREELAESAWERAVFAMA